MAQSAIEANQANETGSLDLFRYSVNKVSYIVLCESRVYRVVIIMDTKC